MSNLAELLNPKMARAERYSCVVLDRPTHARLKEAAKRLRRSQVVLVKAILEDGLDRLEKLEAKNA